MAKEKNNLEVMRHSLSHVLAAAVLDMFPEGKLAIGPAIDNGFYYDFDLPRTLIPEDLPLLEKKMKHILKQNLKFERQDVPVDEAIKISKKAKQPYKTELIEDLKKQGKKEVSFYKTGSFIDLCEGPHVDSTNKLGAFKLSHTAGAYWKGDEKNKMLQRIYAYAFETQKELDEFLNNLEELKKRDHRKLGKHLDLFLFDETAPGMPYWLPKGVTILNELINFWRIEHQKRDYQEIKSPLLNKKELYATSGHWDHYGEEMFKCETTDKETYALKPMNCPNAMVVYKSKLRSYRDLPLRFSDIDTLHRNEMSGTLNGLFRVREFSQDDAHIFVTENQIKEEYGRILEIIELFYSIFNLEYSFRLGTRPEKFMGDPKDWDKAENTLKEILDQSKRKYFVLEGDGAFYGPKIDIIMKDSLGREWQMGTIQLDFQMPKKFGLKYIDEMGKESKTAKLVVIHRVIYGSLERFMGILIEHFAGDFPLWLAPVQVKVIPVSDKFEKFAREIESDLKAANLRVEFDDSDESVGKKIRNAEMQKIPYMIVLGEKEVKSKKLAVRSRKDGDLGQIDTKKLIEKLRKEIDEKK